MNETDTYIKKTDWWVKDKKERDKIIKDDDFSFPPKKLESLYGSKEDGLFHIGQTYEKKVAKTLYCCKCKGNHFFVGVGDHYTCIKCVKCEWEICIHDG